MFLQCCLCDSATQKNVLMVTETLRNPSHLFIASGNVTWSWLVANYPVYPWIPCTTRLPNTRLLSCQACWGPMSCVRRVPRRGQVLDAGSWIATCLTPDSGWATYLVLSTCWRLWHGAASAGISGCSSVNNQERPKGCAMSGVPHFTCKGEVAICLLI